MQREGRPNGRTSAALALPAQCAGSVHALLGAPERAAALEALLRGGSEREAW
jgi:hypothetical protein